MKFTILGIIPIYFLLGLNKTLAFESGMIAS
jgi:hypothetical protein